MIGLRRGGMLALLCLLGCTSEPEASTEPGIQKTTAATTGSSTQTTTADDTEMTSAATLTSSATSTATSGTATSTSEGQGSGGSTDGAGTLDSGAGGAAIGTSGNSDTALTLPEGNAPFDYQLGGAYAPPDGVRIVTRDREEAPAMGLYNVCYVNGFQTQPQDNDDWLSDHADLILHDANGKPFLDEDWGEYLFDTSSEEKRLALTGIVGPWIEGCAESGFDAVEIDNLDSYSRSDGLLTDEFNVSFMASLTAIAHAHGLAIGQKNAAELVPRADELGTDFAVAEECNRYHECDVYEEHYGSLVFVIEYRRQDFDAGCSDFPELSLVLRDLDLSTPASSAYVFDGC